MTPLLKFNKDSLSLTYNTDSNSLMGDTQFRVQALDLDDPSTEYSVDLFVDSLLTITPNPSSNNELNTITTTDPNPTISNGDYIINLTAYSVIGGEDTVKTISIYLKVYDDESPVPPQPTPDPSYVLKYFINNEDHRLEIYKNTTEEIDPVKIKGNITFNYQSKTDLFTPIISSNLKLKLFANQDVSLQDLYSEEEKTYKVILIRQNQIIFTGFIKPDGIYEDYVYDTWELSIDVFDGLSTLKNISFINNNGIKLYGRYSGFDLIRFCLDKTGLTLPINIFCDLFYTNFTGQSIFASVLFNTERYYQNSSEPMDCETVLKSLLQIFNATLIQFNGEWFIYRSIDLKNTISVARYINGIFLEYKAYTGINKTLGSQIDEFEIFHCNKNQRKSIAPSVQAYKITYQYGGAKSIFVNPELKLYDADILMDGWDTNNIDGRVYRGSTGFGLETKTWDEDNGPSPHLITLNQPINVLEGDVLKLSISFGNFGIGSYRLEYSIGSGGQWLQPDGSWNSTQSRIYVNNSRSLFGPVSEGLGTATYDTNVRIANDGMLEIIIYRSTSFTDAADFHIYSVRLTGTTEGDIKGVEYTGRRNSKKSTSTKPNITVYNGDSVSDLFVGTIYTQYSEATTTWWRYRPGFPQEEKQLLEINAEDNLRLSPRPMIIFEGDVYGYIPYLCVLSINNFEGKKFQPIEYSYDLTKNTLKLTSKEYSSDYIDQEDFRVDITNNYGNETKVTIV